MFNTYVLSNFVMWVSPHPTFISPHPTFVSPHPTFVGRGPTSSSLQAASQPALPLFHPS